MLFPGDNGYFLIIYQTLRLTLRCQIDKNIPIEVIKSNSEGF